MIDWNKIINFLAPWEINSFKKLRDKNLQELDNKISAKYEEKFKARLSHALGLEVLKIEKEYGVIIQDTFIEDFRILIPIQKDLRRDGKEE